MKAETVRVDTLGSCEIVSPFAAKQNSTFISENDNVIYNVHQDELAKELDSSGVRFFELAGPREKIFFDPETVVAGIVTCGGLCPGINDVIQAIVVELHSRYRVKKILGFKYGYRGLTNNSLEAPIELTPQKVDYLHRVGGTYLASSRGAQDIDEMIETLVEKKVNILFTVGGDGTMTGAGKMADRIMEKGLNISVIAIPKTIDNDLNYVSRTFGFQTAVEEATHVVSSAHVEAKGAPRGIGLVKLMGRHSGYIATYAALANRDVNYCLIPEVPCRLEGEGGLFDTLRKRLEEKGHAVIVVAEGFGQDLIEADPCSKEKDASGNIKLKNIGLYLKEKIVNYFTEIDKNITLKYIDPSYIIRSVPANAMDSTYCLQLGQNAVHAAMAGRTGVMVGFWNQHFIHVPIKMAVGKRNTVDPNRRLWKSVMEATLQPDSMFVMGE